MLLKLINKTRYLWLVLVGWAVLPAALAAGTTFCDPIAGCNGTSTTIPDLLVKMASYLTILAIPVLAIMILYGAFTIMTSEGNSEHYKKGQRIIVYAIVGFVIIAIGGGIGYIINDILTGGPAANPCSQFVVGSPQYNSCIVAH